MAIDVQYKLNYPIETDNAWAHWESRHKLNRIKAIISFSTDLDNANDNLRRAGYYRQFRKRYLDIYSCLVANPHMDLVPLSDVDEYWWDPIAICPLDPNALKFTTQPTSKTSYAGQTVTFTVAMSGGKAPYTYQWFKNGTAINKTTNASAGTATLSLAALPMSDNGSTYYAEVEDSSTPTKKKVTSQKATLTVLAQQSPAPVITAQPANSTAYVKGTYSVSVTATGDTLTYQWQKQSGSSWNNITGATTNSYTSSTLVDTDIGTQVLRCVVTNTKGTNVPNVVNSNPATITIEAAIPVKSAAPTITTNLVDVTVKEPAAWEIGPIVATGTGVLNYKWYKNGTLITDASAQGNRLNKGPSADADDAEYYVEVYNTEPGNLVSDAVKSAVVHLVVTPADVDVNSITVNGADTAHKGTPETYTVTILPANATDKTVTWTVSPTTNATINATTGVLTPVAAGRVTVTATSTNGKTGTKSVLVALPDAGNPVIDAATPADVTNVSVGDPITLTVSATPPTGVTGGTLSYTWYKGTTQVANQPNSNTYTIAKAAATDSGSYHAVVTYLLSDHTPGTATSRTATVSVAAVANVPVTSIALDGTAASVDVLTGYKSPIKIKVNPTNATNQKVNYTSEDDSIISVINDPTDSSGADGIATALKAGTGITVTGTSDDDATKHVTVSYDVIDAADPGLFLFVQNNIGTQTGWLPIQDATDHNKWTITNTLSTTGRYMGAFVRKDGSTTNITGAADGLTAVSSNPSIVVVDNVGGHGFQMHPKAIGTSDITITTPSGDGHPATPIVSTLTVTFN